MNIFEYTSRNGLRFDSSIGFLATEDLWSLPLKSSRPANPSLNTLAQSLYAKVKQAADTQDFVDDTKDTTSEDDRVRFDVVKYIIESKKADRDASIQARVNAEQKQLLVDILHQKKGDALQELSVEDLEARIKALG